MLLLLTDDGNSTLNVIRARQMTVLMTNKSSRLPDNASIFSAEAKAILLAMTYIETSNRVNHVIFSDSKSVLQAIFEQNWDNPLINQTLIKLTF